MEKEEVWAAAIGAVATIIVAAISYAVARANGIAKLKSLERTHQHQRFGEQVKLAQAKAQIIHLPLAQKVSHFLVSYRSIITEKNVPDKGEIQQAISLCETLVEQIEEFYRSGNDIYVPDIVGGKLDELYIFLKSSIQQKKLIQRNTISILGTRPLALTVAGKSALLAMEFATAFLNRTASLVVGGYFEIKNEAVSAVPLTKEFDQVVIPICTQIKSGLRAVVLGAT